MSLRLKTILGIALIEASLLILLVLTMVNFIKESNYEALSKRASTTATLFATTTQNAVLTFDLASVQSFVHEVMRNPDLVYARVVAPDGLLFAEAGDRSHLKAGVFKSDNDVALIDDDVFDAYANIEESGVIYGRVELGIDVGSITRAINEVTRWSMLLASSEMLLVALFSYILGGYLTGQLKTLRFAAKQVSKGELDIDLKARGRDEIADVCRAFNHMAQSLKQTGKERDQYETSLLELNKTLEMRVNQRTSEVMQKHQELESAYKSLKDTQTKLLKAEKMASVGVLASGVAHEINNPVSFIMSNLHTLQDYIGVYNDAIEQYRMITHLDDFASYSEQVCQLNAWLKKSDMDYIQSDIVALLQEATDGTERIRDIVIHLQEMAATDKLTLMGEVDINSLLISTVTLLGGEIKNKAEVVTHLEELPAVKCMQQQLSQVFMNILMNAAQAVEPIGKIEISTRVVDKGVEISIIDNGMGIEQENLLKVFDPFFTTKSIGEGTGLGLSTAYSIITDHGGDIVITSQVGEGTKVTILIPVSE